MNLKEKLLTTIKVALPIAFGVWLVWFIMKDLTEEDRYSILDSIKNANYMWVALAAVVNVFSHMSRAMRWRMMIDNLGFSVKLKTSFYAVAIAYLANLIFPRLGEVSRCAVLAKNENVPVEKLLGTVIAERIVDSVGLLLLMILTFFTQYSYIEGFVIQEILPPLLQKIEGLKENSFNLILLALSSLLVLITIVWFLKSKFDQLFKKIKNLFLGFSEGLKTVFTIKNPLLFIFHSLFIWAMYFLMMYLMFFSLEATQDITIGAALSVFVLGGLTFIAVQGGIGAYPAVVTQVMMIYGFPKLAGFTFGWLAWTSQTIFIIILGLLAYLMLMIDGKKQKSLEQ